MTPTPTFGDFLSAVARSFLRGFLGAAVVFLPGVLSAPDLNGLRGLGLSALVGSIASGLKAIQILLPQLTVPAGRYTDLVNSFLRAAISAFVTAVVGVLDGPDLVLSRSLWVGLIVGGVVAGIRAVQGFLTPGEVPAAGKGLAWD